MTALYNEIFQLLIIFLVGAVLIFWSYDTLRSKVLPIAAKEPALFLALLYSSCAHLNAMRNRGETALSMAIKAESMRQIQYLLDDPEKRNTTVTVASIGYMSSGVCVSGSHVACLVFTNVLFRLLVHPMRQKKSRRMKMQCFCCSVKG